MRLQKKVKANLIMMKTSQVSKMIMVKMTYMLKIKSSTSLELEQVAKL
jgi:hypothetical protein